MTLLQHDTCAMRDWPLCRQARLDGLLWMRAPQAQPAIDLFFAKKKREEVLVGHGMAKASRTQLHAARGLLQQADAKAGGGYRHTEGDM